jgi:ABC-type antimicrobial peptide transport system permease subunit
MLKNFLKITFRNIKKHKGFSFINIAGLSIGLTCSILIFLWVQDELSYDRFHENVDNIYRLVNYRGDYQNRGAGTPAPLAPALKNEIPEVVNFTRFAPIFKVVVRHNDNIFYEEQIVLADPSIFEMFSFPFTQGDASTALSDPNNVVITEEMAHKYFGNVDPIGKTLFIEEGMGAKVTGVINNIPYNSHIQFDFLLSFQLLSEERIMSTFWGDYNFNSFVQLSGRADIKDLSQRVTEVARTHNDPGVKYGKVKFSLQPLKDIHLDAGTAKAGVEKMAPLGDKKYVYTFSAVAFFVLFIACINFMNLSTARFMGRAREVGLRKVVGSSRAQLLGQFFGESLLHTSLAGCTAVLLVELFLPLFNQLSGKHISISHLDYRFLIGFIMIVFTAGIIAGSYPAFYLSSFKPAVVIRGIVKTGPQGSLFRRILVLVQFSISIGLIIGTSIVYKQRQFIRHMDLGFSKENIILIPVRENIGTGYEIVKQQLLLDPYILGVTVKDWLQIRSQHNTTVAEWQGKLPSHRVAFSHVRVDYDYLDTLNIKIIEGRNFSKDYPTDETEAFIVNEEAVRAMGLESPVGVQFSLQGKKGKIIGVVRNAQFSTLHQTINPQVYHLIDNVNRARAYGSIFIKVREANTAQALMAIEDMWKDINPNSPFEYHFLDESIEQRYKSEKQINLIFNSFAFLAIFISCLGLFGLAAFAAERRTKEIGIRKVLGASIFGIVQMLSLEFAKWVLLANIVAWPVAYYFMWKWLQNFAYRINLEWWIFILSGLLALGIALLTVSYQAVRAATAIPVKTLRYE